MDINHDACDDNFDTPGEGRLYETGGKKCPVSLFLFYLSKLNPNLDALWQRPRQLKFCNNEAIWYCNVPHGVNHLGNMMATLSKKYDLSQRYTNHCVRVTGLQTLDDADIEGRHIIRVSGHKRTDSVENYARRLSVAKKRKISSILTDYCSSENSEAIECEVSAENNKQNVVSSDISDKLLVESMTDISDKEMADIPDNMFSQNRLNFAPVLNNCSNISFNIYVNRN